MAIHLSNEIKLVVGFNPCFNGFMDKWWNTNTQIPLLI